MTTTRRPVPDHVATLVAEIAAPNDPPRALPPVAYVDPDLFELERDRVIERGWWCVGRADDLPHTSS